MSTTDTSAGPPPGAGLPAAPIDLSPKSRPGEAVIKAALLICSLLSIAISFGIVIALIKPVIDFFREVPFGDFFATEGEYAVVPLVAGTLMVTADRPAGGRTARPGRRHVPE